VSSTTDHSIEVSGVRLYASVRQEADQPAAVRVLFDAVTTSPSLLEKRSTSTETGVMSMA